MLPLIIEPDELEKNLGKENIAVVDLSKADVYTQAHIPGALHLDYPQILLKKPPVMGLIPDEESFGRVLSELGINEGSHVIAYDDEGGGKASRLLWTLYVYGHKNISLLNGGLHAWMNEGHPSDQNPVQIKKSDYMPKQGAEGAADKNYILSKLKDKDSVLLDARSLDEFTGAKKFAEKAGHIPGAVHLEWTAAMDQTRNLRLKSREELASMLSERGIVPEKEIIVYCQTHHRSAHTFIMLKSLGYENVRGYAGSWSDWGNSPDTPVE